MLPVEHDVNAAKNCMQQVVSHPWTTVIYSRSVVVTQRSSSSPYGTTIAPTAAAPMAARYPGVVVPASSAPPRIPVPDAVEEFADLPPVQAPKRRGGHDRHRLLLTSHWAVASCAAIDHIREAIG
jgi:hypothetical protein